MKRFKALFMSLVLATCLLGTSASANAASYSTGKALIPTYRTNAETSCNYYVSNITDSPIDITITFYNEDGTLLIDDNSPTTGRIVAINSQLINFNDQNADSSLTFTLNAHSSGLINLPTTTTPQVGYGIIQWTQNGKGLQGLVAWGQRLTQKTTGEESRSTIDINSGLPF